jgi:ABC-2 type transport system permease protein
VRPAPFAARCSCSAPRLQRVRGVGAGVADSAAAIVASFVLPIGFALLGLASQLVANWLDYSTAFDWLLTGQWSGHAAQILVAVALWVAAPLTVGLVRTTRREIN